jgi:hypothetical protein
MSWIRSNIFNPAFDLNVPKGFDRSLQRLGLDVRLQNHRNRETAISPAKRLVDGADTGHCSGDAEVANEKAT